MEHEISMKSGGNISRAVLEGNHHVIPLVITKDNLWSIPDKEITCEEELEAFFKQLPKGHSPEKAVLNLKSLGTEVVFTALHGPFGEDGRIQGFFEILDLPQVGTGVYGSAVSANKIATKFFLRQNHLPTADYYLVSDLEYPENVIENFGFPVVLKAPSQGSSFGLEIIDNYPKLQQKTKALLELENPLMLERFVKGRELTCGVLKMEDGSYKPLPPTEIIPQVSDYFDFEAKYKIGGSLEITPARISSEITSKVQNLALKVHRIFGMGHLSRTDFILDEKDNLFILELNSMPGFTETSLFPQAAAEIGITFEKLVDHLLNLAINRI